jgi:hypothetical protein
LIVAHPLNSMRFFEPFLNAVRHLVLDGFEVMVGIFTYICPTNAILTLNCWRRCRWGWLLSVNRKEPAD